jgi:hypothetical protein
VLKKEKLDRINEIKRKIIKLSGFLIKAFFDFGEVLNKENENQKSYLQKIHLFKTKN